MITHKNFATLNTNLLYLKLLVQANSAQKLVVLCGAYAKGVALHIHCNTIISLKKIRKNFGQKDRLQRTHCKLCISLFGCMPSILVNTGMYKQRILYK